MTEKQRKEILEDLCGNNMFKLKKMYYKKMVSIGGISPADYDDFHSIALAVLHDSINRYEENMGCKFTSYLIGNIYKKFSMEIRDRNRMKRIKANDICSIDETTDDNGRPLEEVIDSGVDVFEEVFGDELEDKTAQYLENLSILQRKIVTLLVQGYNAKDIQEQLHITSAKYNDNLKCIQAYENVKILY